MPIYTYKCPSCGWTGDRKSSISDRDNQSCAATHPAPTRKICGTKLTRDEIPETANMKLNWSYWQVPFDDA